VKIVGPDRVDAVRGDLDGGSAHERLYRAVGWRMCLETESQRSGYAL